MLDYHRGMLLLPRVKAIFWWCYMRSPDLLPTARVPKTMPTDETIENLYAQARTANPHARRQALGGPARWGTAISWEDLHHKTWKR